MRKLFAVVAATAVLIGLAPIVTQALDGRAPRAATPLAGDLVATMDEAAAGESFLVFVHGLTPDAARRGVLAAGLKSVGEFASVGVPVAVGTAAQIRDLARRPGITYIEPNREITPFLETARKATRADEASARTFTTGCPPSPCTQVGPFDGTGQTIAIVDGGVDGTHPMFADPADPKKSRVVRNMKVACLNNIPGLTIAGLLGTDPATCPASYTGDGADNEPFIIDMTATNDTDTNAAGGHGTHVAGIAAGGPVRTSDGRTLQGLAPRAKIVALSMGVGIGIYGADAALDWVARHHADPCGDKSCPPITVVNNSYGSGGDWDPKSVTTKIQQVLIDRGVSMVWANGNGDLAGDGGDGSDNRSGSDAAAQIPGVIAVANYDDGGTGTRDGMLNGSSSRGQASRPATWPDVSAPGTDITSACRPYLAICSDFGGGDPNYGTIGGTSMASPHVAGVVALLRQANPSLKPADVEDILEDTAHRFASGAPYAPDPLNPDTPSSFDKGHGLIDVVSALTAAVGGPRESSASDPSSAPDACLRDRPLLVDEDGDATQLASVNGVGANEKALDLRSLRAAWSPSAKALYVAIQVTDLGDANPSTAPNVSWNATFTHDDAGWYVEATRDAAGTVYFGWGMAFTVDAGVTSAVQRVPLGKIAGALDSKADQITFVLPSSKLEAEGAAPLRTGTVLRDFGFVSRRAGTTQPIALGAAADQPANDNVGCPHTIGYGTGEPPTPPPAPTPPAGPADASLHDGESFVTEAVTEEDTAGYSCTGPGDPKCFTYRVEVIPAGESTINVWLNASLDAAVIDDWDIYVYDAAGVNVDRGFLGAVPTAGMPQTATESLGAFVDVSEPGTYTIVLQPYSALADTTMELHADLIATG